jgi:hypothetical protein
MKQLAIFILTVMFLASCKKNTTTSPTPEPEPNYFTFNGQIGTNDNSTVDSNDDNLVICGNYNNNICILKISKTGNQIWRKDFYSGFGSEASGMIESSDHNFFICGKTSRNQFISMRDLLLIKTNSIGDTLWTKIYGGIKDDFGSQIIKSNDGNIVICGFSYSYNSESLCDIYLIKVNSDGDTLWTRNYPDQGQEVPFHLMETQNGEFLVTGTNEDNSNPRELYLLKVSANGTQVWNKKIGPATWKWGYSTIELSNGDLITCGAHPTNGYGQVLLVKTDHLGNEIWEKEFGENNLSEQGNSIKQNADGTFTITGSSYDVATMRTDIILLKVDQSGNQLWLKKVGSSSDDSGENLIKDNNDDNLISGNYNGNIFFTKTDNNGIFK